MMVGNTVTVECITNIKMSNKAHSDNTLLLEGNSCFFPTSLHPCLTNMFD